MKKDLGRLSFDKIFCHSERLREFLKTGDCTPIHMTIGFAGYCNNNCPWCYSSYTTHKQQPKKVEVNAGALISFLKGAYDAGLKAVTIVGSGEPLLHPKADYLIKEIGKIGIQQGIYTNGTLLDSNNFQTILDNLTFLRVSLDAATPETHAKLHKGPKRGFQNAINSLEYLAQNKTGKFPTLGVQFVTSQHNIHEAVAAVKLARDIGADYIAFKPMMKNPLNPSHDKNILTLDENLQAIFNELKSLSDKGKGFEVYVKAEQFKEVIEKEWNNGEDYSVCLGHCFSPVVNSDGHFYHCIGMEGRPEFDIGSIKDFSFEEMWHGEARKKAIKRINLSKCPSACRTDPLNKILFGLTLEEAEKRVQEAGEPDPEIHPNFL